MCGIVGLFAKSLELEERLGVHLVAMLAQMSDRGPDSAGVAIYRDPVPEGMSKLTLYSPDLDEDWRTVASAVGGEVDSVRASHAVVVVPAPAAEAEARVRAVRGDVRIMSAGRVIEIYKDVGLPGAFAAVRARRPAREPRSRPHADGDREPRHDRGVASVLDGARPLPRPQRVALEPQHAPSVAAPRGDRVPDRERHRGGGRVPRVAPSRGRHARAGPGGRLDDLDGFYTFAVGTSDGFAVLRDPIACKPAVLAETDDWVAMASESHAIAMLPGADDARMWEPEPGVVYVWDRAAVA